MKPLHQRNRERRQPSARVEEEKRRARVGQAITENVDAGIAAIPPSPPVGAGMEWYTPTPPPGWLFSDGRLLEVADYPDLYAELGTKWNTGLELSSQFRLPDRRGRVGVGAGQGVGLTNRALASLFGAERHTLAIEEMPSHSHQVKFYKVLRNNNDTHECSQLHPTGDSSDRTESTGGGVSHNNMQPSLAVHYIIRALP